MTRLWKQGPPIQVETSQQDWPTHFSWQGKRHHLLQVQQHWQIDTGWWSAEGRIWRDYLVVITADGLLCVLYHDLLTQTWHLSKLYD